jgi:hypothetical protein
MEKEREREPERARERERLSERERESENESIQGVCLDGHDGEGALPS